MSSVEVVKYRRRRLSDAASCVMYSVAYSSVSYAPAIWMSVWIIVSAVVITLELAW
jgi:hypothetical protein